MVSEATEPIFPGHDHSYLVPEQRAKPCKLFAKMISSKSGIIVEVTVVTSGMCDLVVMVMNGLGDRDHCGNRDVSTQ